MKNWFKVFEHPKQVEHQEEIGRIDPFLISEFKEFSMLPRYQASLVALYCRMKQKSRIVKTNEFINAAQDIFATSIVEQGIESLIAKNWMRTFSDGSFVFEESLRLTHHVEVALRKSKQELLPSKFSSDPFKEMRSLYAVACSIRRGNRSVLEWPEAIERNLRRNGSAMRTFMKRNDMSSELLQIGIFVTVLNALEGPSIDLNVVLHAFAPDPLHRLILSNTLSDASNPLIDAGILEIEEGFRGDKCLKATSDFLSRCLPGHHVSSPQFSHSSATLIDHKTIEPIELLFNEELNKDLKRITQICGAAVFPKFKSKLVGESCKGVIAQLYGAPGSGKTEFCYQLARQTGRDVLLFDVSQTRNKYFGETEKAIKSLFDAYRHEVNRSEFFPILLFNEGDSIFQNRSDGEQNSSNTENAVQTILLNELERFEGILLITTNMPNLFDAAFNRRFLFRLHFGHPDYEIRRRLLESKFPSLTVEQNEELARYFQFSAAELNNFKKRRLLDSFSSVKSDSIHAALKDFLKFSSVPKRNVIKGYIQYNS
jgi:hypothetical protein